MKQEDEKLRVCLRKAMEMDDIRLDEEMKNSEPHEFSREFEEKMEKVRKIAKREPVTFQLKRFAAAAAVLLAVVGVLAIGVKSTTASKSGFDIITWTKEYFSFKKDGAELAEGEILFVESQIGYLPDGFEKVGEAIQDNMVQYYYENNENNYILIEVFVRGMIYNQDSKDVEYMLKESNKGVEYLHAYKEEIQTYLFVWDDVRGATYRLSGNVALEELISVMENIQ